MALIEFVNLTLPASRPASVRISAIKPASFLVSSPASSGFSLTYKWYCEVYERKHQKT